LAKVDTGAYSGALHCTDIRLVRAKDRTRQLVFTPFGNRSLRTSTSDYKEIYVRSSNGRRGKRYLINTEIILQGKTFPIQIGLSDRSDMKRELLLGRRFLRENNILVDVTINQELDYEGENNS